MATSVEFGPGMTLAALIRSRNCSRVSQPRRSTISSCIRAMCAAGPPKDVRPRRRKRRASSRSLTECRVFSSKRLCGGEGNDDAPLAERAVVEGIGDVDADEGRVEAGDGETKAGADVGAEAAEGQRPVRRFAAVGECGQAGLEDLQPFVAEEEPL